MQDEAQVRVVLGFRGDSSGNRFLGAAAVGAMHLTALGSTVPSVTHIIKSLEGKKTNPRHLLLNFRFIRIKGIN